VHKRGTVLTSGELGIATTFLVGGRVSALPKGDDKGA